MWENFLMELANLFPQLAITFLGVFLAFSLDRVINWLSRRQDRRDLLRDLRDELVETKNKLTGKALMLYPDIWDSAISSGQIRLLNSEQVTKLAKVYRAIKGTEYEAVRLRDAAEDARKEESNYELQERWRNYSMKHKSREGVAHRIIEEILKEKWWKC